MDPSYSQRFEKFSILCCRKNLAILNVFFDSLTGVCYIMDQRQTWADFICKKQHCEKNFITVFCNAHWNFTAAAGGLLGLGFGFSILSAAELLYFFTVRWFYYYYRAKVSQKNTNRILAIYQHQQRTRRRVYINLVWRPNEQLLIIGQLIDASLIQYESIGGALSCKQLRGFPDDWIPADEFTNNFILKKTRKIKFSFCWSNGKMVNVNFSCVRSNV